MIPYGKQSITQSDVDAVVATLNSDFLTQGPMVPRFEDSIKEACGVGEAVAANSATSALHLACMALGVDADSTVWTSPISFVASANCARYCGASVDFVDIDPETFNMCPTALEKKLNKADSQGKLPSVVIPVHMGGQAPEMSQIHALSEKFGFAIIEDASHSIGAGYRDEPVGNCRYSEVTVFSFHPVKIITTAEGGVATTRSSSLADRMRLLRSHGVTRDQVLMDRESHGPWYYQQIELGWNYRMTEIQAALGVSQMNRLSDFIRRRREIAKRYDELIDDPAIALPRQLKTTRSSFHLYIIQLMSAHLEKTHKQIFLELRERGIGVNLHYIPIHLQPYYANLGFSAGDFPNAEAYYDRAISIPVFQDMSDEQQDQVVAVLSEVIR